MLKNPNPKHPYAAAFSLGQPLQIRGDGLGLQTTHQKILDLVLSEYGSKNCYQVLENCFLKKEENGTIWKILYRRFPEGQISPTKWHTRVI